MLIYCNSRAQVNIGLTAGVNYSNIDWRSSSIVDYQYQSVIGLDAGLVLSYSFNYAFSIQPEIHFLQKGFLDDFSNDFSVTSRLNYLEIPILAKYYLGNNSNGVSIAVGPSVGYGLFGTNSQNGFSNRFNFQDYSVNKIDLSGQATLNFETYLNGNLTNFSIKYLHGFNNVFLEQEENIKINNRGIQVSVLYFLLK